MSKATQKVALEEEGSDAGGEVLIDDSVGVFTLAKGSRDDNRLQADIRDNSRRKFSKSLREVKRNSTSLGAEANQGICRSKSGRDRLRRRASLL